jgi:plastocyanin
VHLDGSKSYDQDGNSLSYSWSIISVPGGSLAALSSTSAVQPTFTADTAGNYVFQLVVNDGTTNSTASTVTISTTNSAPVANAGPDQTVQFGATVQLDGSSSTDVDGNLLAYNWTLISAPAGSAATLSGPATARPTFVIDRPGNYVAQLVVNDGVLSSIPSTVTVSTVNSLPVANAGASQTVAIASTVHLDGSNSYDVDGNPLMYRWAILSAPTGSNAAISNPTDIRPTFVADRAGLYVVQLIVNDGTGDSVPSTMTVSTVNTPPVANAGLDQAITAGSTVQLDGSRSTDADGNLLSYRWALVSRPGGSSATVQNANSVRASFAADVAGTYVAQLIVRDGQVNSAPSVVHFSTTNNRPVANAGTRQIVTAGTTVQLDGSRSTDADGNPLTFQWALVSKPAGSVAYIDYSNIPNPTFVADKAGDYVAQLITADATLSSLPSSVVISTTSAAPTANAGTGHTVTAGTVVQLDGSGSSDPAGNTLSYAWSLITVPVGSSAVLAGAGTQTPTFTPDVAGDYVAQLVVNNGTISSAPSTVRISTVSSRPLANAGAAQQVLVGANLALDGSGSNSPDGRGLTYKWSLLSVPTGSTASLSNPAALNPSITIDKRGAYVAQLIVTDGVYISDPSTVEITTNNRPPVANAGSAQTVPVGTTVTLDGSGSTDPDGYPLTYNWSFLSLPDGSNPTLTGGAKVTFVPDTVGTYVAQLIVTDGLLTSAPVTVSITTTPNQTISFSPSPLAVDASSSGVLTVTLGQAAPTGGVTVNLSSSDTTIATVPSSITVTAGQTVTYVTVTSLAKTGSATITGSATGYTNGTVTVNVTARTLTFETLTVGKNLQAATQLTLSTTAPTTGVKVTLTSSDTSKLLLSTAGTSVGSGSISITVPSGSLNSPTFYVQAKDSTGTATITASASGYADTTTAVTLAPAGFFASNLNSINTTTLAADTSINIAAAALDPVTLKPLAIQQVQAGSPAVNVSIDNPSTSVGTITVNPLTFNPGDAMKTTAFHPLAAGSMNLTVTPPSGFTAPSQQQVLPTTVVTPSINIGNITVGKDMQLQDGAWLQTGAPTGGVDITFTSSDPGKVLLSTSPTTAGSASITLHYAAAYTAQLYFYVQALADTGTATITAQGTGYASSTATVTLAPSGFVISNGNITNATAGGPDVPIGIAAAVLQPGTLNFGSYQQLRAGISPVNVAVNSSNTSVATITTSPVVFNATDQSRTTALHPLTAGNTTVSVVTPAGFSTPSQFQSISATVSGAGINTSSNVNTGQDLMTSSSFTLSTAPSSPVSVTVTSNTPSVATVSASATAAGSSSVSFANISTQTTTYYVQGISAGTTTLTIQAPGYASATVTVTVYPSGFILSKSSLSTSVGTDTTVSISPAVLLPGTLDVYDVQSLRPGLTVQVPITSSNTAVGTVISPVSVTGGAGTTTFHAVAAGSTNLVLATPAGYSTPNVYQSLTVTVAGITAAADISVGKDLMTSSNFALNTPPASPVTVTVTSNSPAVATVSTSSTTAGTSSISFSSISTQTSTYYIQGLAPGTTTLTISATGYASATVNVTVYPSGFVLTTGNFSLSAGGSTSVGIAPTAIVPNLADGSVQQPLRPGVTVQVPITSSNTAVGTVTSPISISGGSATTTFKAVAAGSTNLTLGTPAGYNTPSLLQQITATVQ